MIALSAVLEIFCFQSFGTLLEGEVTANNFFGSTPFPVFPLLFDIGEPAKARCPGGDGRRANFYDPGFQRLWQARGEQGRQQVNACFRLSGDEEALLSRGAAAGSRPKKRKGPGAGFRKEEQARRAKAGFLRRAGRPRRASRAQDRAGASTADAVPDQSEAQQASSGGTYAEMEVGMSVL